MAVTKFKALKLGDKGLVVKKISELLKKAGSTIKPTSEFHIGMVSAVKAFQKKNGLPVTGTVDRKTFDKLSAVKAPKKAKK